MASASLSRRPSSLASAEPTLCRGTLKLSGQLPHTSSRVTPRPSNGPACKKQTKVQRSFHYQMDWRMQQYLQLYQLWNNELIHRIGIGANPVIWTESNIWSLVHFWIYGCQLGFSVFISMMAWTEQCSQSNFGLKPTVIFYALHLSNIPQVKHPATVLPLLACYSHWRCTEAAKSSLQQQIHIDCSLYKYHTKHFRTSYQTF